MKKFFRFITLLEGLSYILLLFIAVPIKYWAGDDAYVKLLGMPHGVLFMLYLVLAFLLKEDYQWNKRDMLIICLASIIPFGTFYVDKKYLR
jgi:integral membrane protein